MIIGVIGSGGREHAICTKILFWLTCFSYLRYTIDIYDYWSYRKRRKGTRYLC